mmetsp:Transcript_5376/g.11327  ORF Transcript_5376/g.11327 Transcript_5376/m.11327 type:complete len:114 (+) Transcript_5376:1-342(+)
MAGGGPPPVSSASAFWVLVFAWVKVLCRLVDAAALERFFSAGSLAYALASEHSRRCSCLERFALAIRAVNGTTPGSYLQPGGKGLHFIGGRACGRSAVRPRSISVVLFEGRCF